MDTEPEAAGEENKQLKVTELRIKGTRTGTLTSDRCAGNGAAVPEAARDGAPSKGSCGGPQAAVGHEELRPGSAPPSPPCHLS